MASVRTAGTLTGLIALFSPMAPSPGRAGMVIRCARCDVDSHCCRMVADVARACTPRGREKCNRPEISLAVCAGAAQETLAQRRLLPLAQPLASARAAMAVRQGDPDVLDDLDTRLSIQRDEDWLDDRMRHGSTTTEWLN